MSRQALPAEIGHVHCEYAIDNSAFLVFFYRENAAGPVPVTGRLFSPF